MSSEELPVVKLLRHKLLHENGVLETLPEILTLEHTKIKQARGENYVPHVFGAPPIFVQVCEVLDEAVLLEEATASQVFQVVGVSQKLHKLQFDFKAQHFLGPVFRRDLTRRMLSSRHRVPRSLFCAGRIFAGQRLWASFPCRHFVQEVEGPRPSPPPLQRAVPRPKNEVKVESSHERRRPCNNSTTS